ncbi:hypothetical protein BHE74_00050184 [Ensete ventricosum]|uniref:Uncharacterized protein n=1 Tax=Ensete ventricosum TaxID=4639 RepID=A0A444D844_ENSVE|nr:hypothetical protein B296_00049168 [Ensete ventricosum]RWV94271.1 hypothetical protein GW17_00043204 [Ensete ventricosum]RWW44089.1 hypothetical protein BHE74_00050184 [Ensete ventricosum]RZS22920.1 hypothetical protein BHM03_00055775 [Ensete ventricosum]
MRDFRLKCFGLMFLVILVMCSKLDGCEGRKGRHWRKQKSPYSSLARKKGKNGGGHNRGSGGGGDYLSPALSPTPITEYPTKTAMFNVIDFGAKGDGITDDTEVAIINAELSMKLPQIKPTVRFLALQIL